MGLLGFTSPAFGGWKSSGYGQDRSFSLYRAQGSGGLRWRAVGNSGSRSSAACGFDGCVGQIQWLLVDVDDQELKGIQRGTNTVGGARDASSTVVDGELQLRVLWWLLAANLAAFGRRWWLEFEGTATRSKIHVVTGQDSGRFALGYDGGFAKIAASCGQFWSLSGSSKGNVLLGGSSVFQ